MFLWLEMLFLIIESLIIAVLINEECIWCIINAVFKKGLREKNFVDSCSNISNNDDNATMYAKK